MHNDYLERIKNNPNSKEAQDLKEIAFQEMLLRSEQMQKAFDNCPEIIKLILEGKIDLAMNRYNSWP